MAEALVQGDSGRVFGGALGFKVGYLDRVICDGNESLRLIEASMKAQNLAGRYPFPLFATA